MEYELQYARRKSIGVRIEDGRLIVRAPVGTPRQLIEAALAEHQRLINKKITKSKEKLARAEGIAPLTSEELRAAAREAYGFFDECMAKYEPMLGVKHTRLTVRCQKTRWGSCSANGAISLNCLLMFAPRRVAESVAAHELCHLLEPNHGKRFYGTLRRVFPDYDACAAWLKEHGCELLARIPHK